MKIWRWVILVLVAAGMNYVVAWYRHWRWDSEWRELNNQLRAVRGTPAEKRIEALQGPMSETHITPPVWPSPPPSDWPTTPTSTDLGDYGWFQEVSAMAYEVPWKEGRASLSMFEKEVGWPWRGVFSRSLWISTTPTALPHCEDLLALEVPESFRRWVGVWRLPLGIRPLAFAANALVYGTVMWAFAFLPWRLRRRWRVKRGRCVGCGYPVDAGAVCSECGLEVREEIA